MDNAGLGRHRPAEARVALGVRHAVGGEDGLREAALTLAAQHAHPVRATHRLGYSRASHCPAGLNTGAV